MKTKRKSGPASDVLGQLAELTKPQDGKPGLPEPDPEYTSTGYAYEPDEENTENETTEEIAFTDKDRTDLAALEEKVTAGKRQAFESLRAIRCRQLWRLFLNDEGTQRYRTFDQYCDDRWGHRRQWVTHGTNWLRIMEECEQQGLPVTHLSVKAAQGLLTERLSEAGGLRVVLEEAQADGVPFERDHLREIVMRRADFNYLSKEGYEGRDKPAAKTYAEYKKDLATIKDIENGPLSYGIIDEAKNHDGDFADNLVALCKEQGKLPKAEGLMASLTGEALENVVTKLKVVVAEQAEIEKKKEALAARRKEIRARQKDPSLRKLREEEKALKEELKAKGVSVDKSSSSPSQEEASEEKAKEESEVYTGLETALANLEDALTSEWPADEDELNSILRKAQDCEDKLAEITAKAKELLAEVPQPEVVPSGSN